MPTVPKHLKDVYEAYKELKETRGIAHCGEGNIAKKLDTSSVWEVKKALKELREKGLIPAPANRPRNMRTVDTKKEASIKDELLKLLQRRKDTVHTLSTLSDILDRSPKTVQAALDELTADGYNVYIDGDHVALTLEEGSAAHTEPTPAAELSFGVVSDTHLCSKRERLDVINDLYAWFQDEGLSTVYHAGNIIEGESKFNVRERHTHGMDNQIRYMLAEYPQREGITTRLICGDDHEGWYQQREGISIGRHMISMAQEAGREDLEYLGYLEHDIEFRNDGGFFMMKIMHPGGGSAYALSYQMQKIVESFQGGEKPAVLVCGHYHKMEYIPHLRNVRVVQAGCTVEQGTWSRKKMLDFHLGGWIFHLNQCPRTGALLGARFEDRTYFDKGLYQDYDETD